MKPQCEECGKIEGEGTEYVDQRPDGRQRSLLCWRCYARQLHPGAAWPDDAGEDGAGDEDPQTVLSKLQAEVWSLKDSGLSLTEIADELGKADGTIKKAWAQAKRNRRQAERSINVMREIDEMSAVR